ncbi:unnamed protein product [Polarella glacialis]|uniref:RING-type E3 ubiquitin transferase n=1 Tax=Polarella glacialis TaxID=89957 RepID=A0A813KVR3_POLGL|nr:unnamed protein product [Polarella glacialis]
MLEFQFWNDRCYQSYPAPEQQQLNSAFTQLPPRPKDVQLGKYVVRDFQEVEQGHATQVNSQTKWPRWVRIRPPYALPGAASASLPAGPFHFEYEDGDWHPYAQEVQQELQQLARCAPPPAATFFGQGGHSYALLGLDSLVPDSSGRTTEELQQVNVKTQRSRRVRLVPGFPGGALSAAAATSFGGSSSSAAPAGKGSSSSSAGGKGKSSSSAGKGFSPYGPMLGSSSSSSGYGQHGKGNGKGKALGKGSTPRPARAFSLSSAVFLAGSRRLPPELAAELVAHWRLEPRPELVVLSSGDEVQNFHVLELGGAVLREAKATLSHRSQSHGRDPLPLELKLRLEPAEGGLQLPEDLDEDHSADLEGHGRYLADREIARLASGGCAEDLECSICLCEMELEVGGSSSSNCNVDLSLSNDGENPSCAQVDDDGDVEMNGSSGQGGPSGGPVFVLRCGHAYHTECLKRWFAERRRCPRCQLDFGKVFGHQPRHCSMSWRLEAWSLPGHQDSSQTIIVQFRFPAGTDEQGRQYEGRSPKGYLPCNAQGILLLELFQIAFRFGLGTSMSYGSYRPTFNIHIKTSSQGGAAKHGYPDPEYFSRALDELRTNGVAIAELS